VVLSGIADIPYIEKLNLPRAFEADHCLLDTDVLMRVNRNDVLKLRFSCSRAGTAWISSYLILLEFICARFFVASSSRNLRSGVFIFIKSPRASTFCSAALRDSALALSLHIVFNL
jgi:hypothetical protein